MSAAFSSRSAWVALALTTLVAGTLARPMLAAPDDEAKKTDKAAEEPKEEEPEGPRENPYLAPAGMSGEDLVKYLDRLQNKPKTIKARPEYIQAVVDTADRILAAKVDDKYSTLATMAMFGALYDLSRRGEGASYEKLLAMAGKYKDDPRAPVADEAKLVLLQDKVEKVNFDEKEKLPALLAEVKAYFKGQSELGERHLALASGSVKIANALPTIDDMTAIEAYRELGESFAKSKHDQLAGYGKQLQKMANKLELMLKPVEIAGNLLDGKPLDWSAYKGKVVLIDFWATWCGPCVAEIPNVKKAYEEWHKKGFEIIGISLDEDVEALKTFITEKEIPWPTMVSTDKETAGPKHPMATKFGVRAIPSMILIGKDGKIVSTNARGEELTKQLERLLGEGAEAREKEAAERLKKAVPVKGRPID